LRHACLSDADAGCVVTEVADHAREGRRLKAAGRLEEAALAYRRATVARPDSAVAEHNLASVLGDLSDFAGSADAAARAIAKGGNAPETWLVRARALQGLGELEEAEAAFIQAIALRPAYAVAHRDLAQLRWMRSADLRTALAALDRVIADERPDPNLVSVKASVLLSGGDAAAAAVRLEEAIARAPDLLSLRLAACNAHAALGNAGAQLAHALAALHVAPSATEAAKAAVEALLHAGRADEASTLAGRIAVAAPGDQGVLALQLTAWRLLGDPRHAALAEDPALISLVTIEPPPAWRTLGAFLADLGAALRRRHGWRTHPIDQSLRHGSQTQEDLTRVDDPVIRALFSVLDQPIRQYIASLGEGTDAIRRRVTSGYRFAGAWSVLLQPGGYHTDHVHPQGWISSAFYVDVPPAVATPPQGWLAFGRPGVPTASKLPPLRHIQPAPGTLALFPSCFWHGTEPFDGDIPRLTVAFDLVPV
jgi:tetratricopeptide (TPR) repeat protein